MKTKTGNKNQTDFSAVGPTYFELWVMETELWAMETQKPNSLFVSSPSLHKRPPPLGLKVLSPEERTMVHNGFILPQSSGPTSWISVELWTIDIGIVILVIFLEISSIVLAKRNIILVLNMV